MNKQIHVRWLLAVLAAAVLVIIIAVTIPAQRDGVLPDSPNPYGSGAPKADSSELNATIRLAQDVPGVEITNNDSAAWDSCKLKLNDKWERSINGALAPNNPLNNPYALFTASDGTRFDPSTTTPKNVFVSCTVNGENKTNYYLF